MKDFVFKVSLLINIVVALPALALALFSEAMQYNLYQYVLAPKLGHPEIAFIGDSLTEDGHIWAYRIGKYDFNVWNFGKGGAETRQMQSAADKVVGYKSKYAFIMAGTNDPDKSIAGAHRSFEYYQALLMKLIEAGVKPVITLTLYREVEKNPEFIDELNKLLTGYAREHDIPVIDLTPLLCPNKSLAPIYSRDGVHLTSAAYDVWGNEIRKVLDRLETGNK